MAIFSSPIVPYQHGFDMQTALFDLTYERSVGYYAGLPGGRFFVGGALFRLVHEWRFEASVPIGHFDGTYPLQILTALPAATSLIEIDSPSAPALYHPDPAPPSGVVDHRFFTDTRDAISWSCMAFDADFGAPYSALLPTLKKWCEAMGGTYQDAQP